MNQIHGRELKSRLGFLLLAVFGFYLIAPVKVVFDAWIPEQWRIPFGVAGFLAVLYFFKF